MTKLILSLCLGATFCYTQLFSQTSFSDDFESYTPNTYLANSSNKWVTWNNAPGTSEDAEIVTNNAASGSNSIYFESQGGGGPQDVVLPFNGVQTSGRFKMTSKWYVTGRTGAYFNFQGGASIGSSWTLDVYMYDDGYIDIGGYIYTNYPQDQWFDLTVDVDLTNNNWEFFIDGNSIGSFSNWSTSISYLDIYPLFSAAFWVDDVSYCIDNACLPDISMDQLNINPAPLCSNHYGEIELTMTNNGPDDAKEIVLGLTTDGKNQIQRTIDLNNLPMGQSITVTIPDVYKTNAVGNNIEVKAINLLGDRYTANDEVTTSITVLPSPTGTGLVEGSVFQGYNRFPSPDLLELAKTNEYEITPPTGYSNSTYQSDWEISLIEIKTESGVLLSASDYVFNQPSGANNGTLSITGKNAYLDSLLTIYITVQNLITGCDSTNTRKLRIVPTPEVNFKFPASACLGDDIPFENLSSIHSGQSTYMWYFDDGDSSDNDNPYHQYTSAGSFDVRLVATSQPYLIVKDTIITIQVNDIPNTKFSVKNNCEGINIEFNNSTTVSSGTLSYDWDFGDGSAHSALVNPTHLYSNFGLYKVTLSATANGCVSTLTKSAYTFETPVAGFTPPSIPYCALTNVTLANESTLSFGKIGTYWTLGDGKTTTQFNATHAYSTAGTYPVTLLAVSEFGCRDSITKNVVIKPSPSPEFSGNQFCGKIPTIFTNTTFEEIPNPVYNWSFSDGYTSLVKNVVRTWPIEGPYTATLTAKYSNGCEASITKNLTVLIQPKADFTVEDICAGKTASFVNLSTGDRENIQFYWDFGNGDNSTLRAPVNMFDPIATTTYTVALVASYAQGCSDTMRKSLNVNESPSCEFTFKDLGLNKTSFTPANNSYSKYEWYFGEGGSSTDAAPIYNYLYSGNFDVTLKATNSAGCECQLTKRVSATTDINSVTNKSGISVYPNPNNGNFTISNASGNAMKVEVYNVLGEKVYTKTTAEGNMIIDLEGNSRGIYLVKITVNGITTTTKITVTN